MYPWFASVLSIGHGARPLQQVSNAPNSRRIPSAATPSDSLSDSVAGCHSWLSQATIPLNKSTGRSEACMVILGVWTSLLRWMEDGWF